MTEHCFSSIDVAELLRQDQVHIWSKRTLGIPGFPYLISVAGGETSDGSLKVWPVNARGDVAPGVAAPLIVSRSMTINFESAGAALRVPLREFSRTEVRAQRMAHERPTSLQPGSITPNTATHRLQHSFASVELQRDHLNYGDEGPFLRDFGFSPKVAAALVTWGEESQLVCTFENAVGVSDGRHCWKPAFLVDACLKHMELFGSGDLPEEFICWAEKRFEQRHEERAMPRERQSA